MRGPATPAASTGELAASACRVMAPITIERPFCSTPLNAFDQRQDRSSADGCASRCFITGSSEWPPASSFASGLRASRPAAWRTVVGRWKVKLYIACLPVIYAAWRGCRVFERRPNRIGGGRHGEFFAADRIGDGVDHGCRCRDRPGLAAAFDAERIGRRLGFSKADLERRQVVRMRHGVVHQRPGHELTVFVVDRALQQRLPDALRDAAMHLALRRSSD